MISLEGWPAGMCADRKKGKRLQRHLSPDTALLCGRGPGGQHLHFSSGAQLSFKINLHTCIISKRISTFFRKDFVQHMEYSLFLPCAADFLPHLFIYFSMKTVFCSGFQQPPLMDSSSVLKALFVADPAKMWTVYCISLCHSSISESCG